MKNKFYQIVIFFLAATGIAQAQIEFPAPTFVESNSSTWGTWMQDPIQPNSEKVWVIPGYNLNMVYEYSSMANLHSGNVSKTYTLPFAFAGTGHVIYDGSLYFNKNGTNNLVKYNLATESVELDVPLSDAGFMSTYPYEWYGFSDLDLAVDGSDLFVMYSTDANAGKLVVSKLDPATLSVIQTWNTNSELKNQMGDAFIIDGIVYCIDSFYQTNETINYTYNTNTSTGTSTSIPWTNGSTYMTSCTYNSRNGLLYSWNNGGLYFYNLSPTISEVTGSTLICPGTSTTLTAHSSALPAEFKWYDAASGGNLLYTGSEVTTPALTNHITYYVAVTSNGKTSLRTAVSILVPVVINSSVQTTDLLCSQGAPATKNKAVTSLDYSWLATSCSGSQNLSFSINGTIIYIGEADEGSCNCAPNIKTLQITDSLALATLVNGDNTFVADFSATDYQSWAFVKVNFADGTSQIVKLFELYDSNNGQDNYLCNAYQYQGTYEVTENLQLSTSATGGTIDLTITGNLEPITYLWNNGATTQDIKVASGGNYSVVITDACGQTKTESVSIAEPTPIVTAASVTHIASPLLSDGSVDLSVSGGTAPYSFSWNNGRTSEDIDNLTAGVYTCTVRDSFGCTALVQVTVPQSTPFSFTANTHNTSCSNASDGSISVIATGGTDPYQYSKDGGATYQTSNIFAELVPGSYSLLVKDDHGTLTEIQNISITFIDTTPPTVVTKNIAVELDGNGVASILPSAIDNGSTDNCSVATYVLSNSSFDCSSVGPNIVTLTITDATGNAAVGTAIVTVVDNAPPVMSCPASITVNNDINTCGALVYYELPSVIENCPANTNNLVVNGSFESGDYEGWQLSSSPSQYGTFGIGVAGQTINGGESIFDFANNAVEAVMSPGLPYTPAPTDGERMGVFFQSGLATHSLFQDITLPQGSISLCLDLGYNNHFPGGFTATQFVAVELRNSADNSIYATLFKTLGNSPSFRPLSNMCFDISAFAGRQVRLQLIDASIQSFFLDVYFDNIKVMGGGLSATQTAGLPSGSVFPFGKTTNSFIATDASGNSSVCSFDVIVKDNQAPTVAVQNRTIQLDIAGNASISAEEINNASSDNCGIGSMILSKTNFDCTNLGDNIVTLTVTDLSGNSASATAIVTVADLIPPTAIAQNITAYLDSTGVTNITPDAVSISSDNCLIATLSLDKISFDKSNLGDNTVVLTVIDLSNNVSHDTATIRVIDNRAPIVITKNIIVHLDSSGSASITTAEVDNGSSDNCGIATMTLSRSNFDCSSVGNNTVTLTVTDVSGNTSTATSTVSVVDNIMPVLVGLPSNMVVGACDTVVNWTPPTASDNCFGVTVVRSAGPAPGDLNAFAMGANLITYRAIDASGNFTEASFTVTRPTPLTSSITTNNPYLHFGYSDDQVATIMVRPLGGVGPYTVSVTMNRNLSCGLISTLLGESWSAANATNSNNSCSASGAPISFGSVSSGSTLTLAVSLMSNATIVATITDANGCVTTNDFEIGAEDDRCLDGLTIGQIKICHRAGNQCQSMCVDALSVAAHLAHGDYLGTCGDSCAPATAKEASSTITASAAKPSPEETGSDKIAADNTTLQDADIVVEAFPNPFKSSIYVRLSNPEEKAVSMDMFDLMGKYVPLKALNKTPEGVQVLDTERLTAGLYFLQVKIGEYSKTVKLIKE